MGKRRKQFPSEIPNSEDEWKALVEMFLSGLKKIMEYISCNKTNDWNLASRRLRNNFVID